MSDLHFKNSYSCDIRIRFRFHVLKWLLGKFMKIVGVAFLVNLYSGCLLNLYAFKI